ncbi:DUF4402 domain-containing protein [Pedobacter petrophilus]|uniref:DUF4402 domain-containing protein n=1 Tax=Pedobacter petrophilus TaxID=1908241 RepID=A0A7K0FS90_9SPHI|nr:DUF4402 domain-containing protein [Pedobacter petrophilus]MRX74475.1 DUF4402 domain-containing protein [Pedobacter petrophilus]
MKKLFTCLCAMIALMYFNAGKASAQATASANASATIVTPISITKVTDMNFGNVAVSATAGSVILAPAGTRTTSGGVTLPAVNGTVTAAVFTVNGEGAYTYAITLPSTALTITNGAVSMTVTAFTSTPSATGTLAAGTQTLSVGATLNVAASQAAGLYTSATPFNVTVNYN